MPSHRRTGEDLKLGYLVRAARVEKGVSQAALGALLDVSFQQIQKYERGENRLSAVNLKKIAAHLEKPISFFFNEEDPLYNHTISDDVRGLLEEASNLISVAQKDIDVAFRMIRKTTGNNNPMNEPDEKELRYVHGS